MYPQNNPYAAPATVNETTNQQATVMISSWEGGQSWIKTQLVSPETGLYNQAWKYRGVTVRKRVAGWMFSHLPISHRFPKVFLLMN